MSRQLRCPNCGGEHTLVNPGITMLVCSYCKTTLYWSADAVLKTGVQAILPEENTRLYLQATGKLRGTPDERWRELEVVGHLRYDYGQGTWDEWYLQLADGGVAWLSEDERELSLEQAARIDSTIPPPERLRPGHPVTLEGVAYTVREVGTATCLGGEGQLPFTILPGERYPYADLASADGTRFATLEFDEGGVHAFAGVVLTHEQLALDDEPPPSTAGGREAKQITCPNCAAPLAHATRGREPKTVVCDYCGAQNALEGAEARVAGVNPKGVEPGFVFAIGDPADLRGARYEVCGRLLYSDAEGYTTREYLLFNAGAGYLWLAEENGHYVLNRPTQQAPSRDPFSLSAKQSVTVGPTSFRFYESGTLQLVYVDGAIPWSAASGEQTLYADLIAPPQMFSVERSRDELEYFVGQYLPPDQVWAAFKRTERPPRAASVHAAQPFVRGPVAKTLMVIGAIFGLLNLGLLGWSATSEGTQIFEQTFGGGDYASETLSKPFDVGRGRVMALSLDAPLRDSWLAVNIGLVDAEDRVVQELEGDISLYSGVEEGESWTEGSSHETTYFKAPLPGSYRFVLKANGGSGLSGPAVGEPLTVQLRQGAILSRYFLAICILGFLFPLFELTRQFMFEKRRWGPVTEDDDDDGGDDD
jgi:hypothetical protein